MAISFKESPWYIQALVFVALAVVLLAAGEYVPGLPVAKLRTELQKLHEQDSKLNQEVSALQVYERRYSEFQVEMAALNKQLDTLKTIVPEEKETDEFMRQMQGAAAAAGVQIRKLTAQPVVSRDYHYEMPFSIQVDGPYFSIVDFF
jgi:Tfp pilus assembly protein PilO